MTPRVLIAIPSYKGFNANGQTASILGLFNFLPDVEWRLSFIRSCSILHTARNILIAEAIATKCTHILFADDDIQFKWQDVKRMIEFNLPIICTVAQKRNGKWNDPATMAVSLNDLKINPDHNLGILSYPRASFGLGLIQVDCLEDIKPYTAQYFVDDIDDEIAPHVRTYFWHELVPAPVGSKSYQHGLKVGLAPHQILISDGEDHYFARNAQRAGIQIVFDLNAELIHFEGNLAHDYSVKQIQDSQK